MWWMVALAFAEPAPELVSALSARHMTTDCAALVETHGVEALVEVADGMQMPPWLPMRAAHCVGTVADRGGERAILRWLRDEDLPGLAAAAVTGLEAAELPEGLVEAVKSRLVDERFERAIRLDRSRHPELVELVPQP